MFTEWGESREDLETVIMLSSSSIVILLNKCSLTVQAIAAIHERTILYICAFNAMGRQISHGIQLEPLKHPIIGSVLVMYMCITLSTFDALHTRIHEIVTIPDGKWQLYEGPQMAF